MKRIALILAILGILSVAVGNVQADEFHRGHGAHYGAYYGGHHHGPVVVRSPVWAAPLVVTPYLVHRPYYYYGYPEYYYPRPSYGFYYQGSGLSVSVGF
jgi:hypothetical protein